MSDIMNFRLMRAPQRYTPSRTFDLFPQVDPGDGILLTDAHNTLLRHVNGLIDQLATASRDEAVEIANTYVTSSTFAGGGVPLAPPLRALDKWLTEYKNRAEPAAIIKFLNVSPSTIVNDPSWKPTLRLLADSLVMAMIADVDPAVRGELARLLLIASLLEAMATIPTIIKTSDDVFAQLRWTKVILPVEILNFLGSTARLARRYGFSDYYLVREEWNEYRAGEIAHIENVLKGEFRERSTTKLSQTETTAVIDSTITKSEEHDTQTTDRLEMQQHSQIDISLAAHIDGKVDTSGQYGPTKVETHIGGSFDYAKSEASDHALTLAKEIVSQAVIKVEQKTRTVRTTRQLNSFEEKNIHQFDNKGILTQNVTGIYRWVDKIQRLQIFRFPHRLLLEFQVPEPATFLRWRRKQNQGDYTNPEPLPLYALDSDGKVIIDNEKPKLLTPTDITETNYIYYIGRYNVSGVDLPPSSNLVVSNSFEFKQSPASGGSITDSNDDKTAYDLVSPGNSGQNGVLIPPGYQLEKWIVRVHTYGVHWTLPSGETMDPGSPFFIVTIAQNSVTTTYDPSNAIQTAQYTYLLNDPKLLLTGNVPLTVYAQNVREFHAHVQLSCKRLLDTLVTWQLKTYEAIVASYMSLKQRHDEEKSARSVEQGVLIEGDSPERNAEVIREELKRAVIYLVSSGTYPPVNTLMAQVDDNTGPVLDLNLAAKSAPAVLFLEQAFEWENLSYVLYPYFWSAKENWKVLADIKNTDANFARFLRSGSARVVVPARPGFEDQVCMYVDLGVLWSGGPVPVVGDPEYLSIAEEITAQKQAPRTGEAGEWWDVKLPTTLVALDSEGTLPKVNPKPELGPV